MQGKKNLAAGFLFLAGFSSLACVGRPLAGGSPSR